MIGHDYMIVSPYGPVVFTTSCKKSRSCKCHLQLFPPWLQEIFNGKNLILKYNYTLSWLMSYYHVVAENEFNILLTIYEWTCGNLE
jgi:hypothetical protein